MSERVIELNGTTAVGKIESLNNGKKIMIEINADKTMPALLIEMVLYDFAHLVAVQHGLVETMIAIKEGKWS